MKGLLLFTLVCSTLISSPSKVYASGANESLIKVSAGSFNPLDGGSMSSLNGCFINRLESSSGRDGNMYAGIDLPVGATITRIIAHIDDWPNPNFPHNPNLKLRKHTGIGNITILATAIHPDPVMSGYYAQEADVDPDYVVQNGDFFDLYFETDTPTINANYICGVEVYFTLPNSQ